MSPTISALLADQALRRRRAVDSFSRKVLIPLAQSTSLGLRFEPTRLIDRLTPVLSTDEANLFISDAISQGVPAMIARFGESEVRAALLAQSFSEWSSIQRAYWMLTRLEIPKWSSTRFDFLASTAGFFPTQDRAAIVKFCRLLETSGSAADLLGSWVAGENFLVSAAKKPSVTALGSLEPFTSPTPWTHALAGRKVLIVHPFQNSIQQQFTKREKIFPQSNLLPDFELITVSPPVTFGPTAQSLIGEGRTWFSELDALEQRVAAENFDVAIIGAGAYGMPLAAFVKKLGKVAIHLGGATQLLFGIWGSRWDLSPPHVRLKNDYWVRPSADERPAGWQSVEGGAYW
jgi:hypothetical protein